MNDGSAEAPALSAGAALERERAPDAPAEPLTIAFVVQRYGEDVNGGAEYHCRLVAEHLASTHRVEVLTTCARNYITWANERRPGLDAVFGIPVRRFKVRRPRDPDRFGRLSQKVFLGRHTDEEELDWLEEQGPYSTALLRYIRRNADAYDYFVFFSYRYYHSFHGVRAVAPKAILVPTAEKDEVVRLRIFRELFHLPRAIVYNSIEEREMIWRAADNRHVFGDVVGVGSSVPESSDAEAFRARHGIQGPYAVYIGRVDPNKGCRTLFHYFRRFREETSSDLTLVLVGGRQMDLPDDPSLRYLGFLPENEKWGALSGADLLIMPSELESLSMVTLEAWAFSKPVLVNGKCDVLRGQCRRANGGLYFDDYYEFKEALAMLASSPELRLELGRSGRRYYDQHYQWDVVVDKYNRIFDRLRRDDIAAGRGRSLSAARPALWRRLFG